MLKEDYDWIIKQGENDQSMWVKLLATTEEMFRAGAFDGATFRETRNHFQIRLDRANDRLARLSTLKPTG